MKRAAVQWGIGRYLYNLEEGFAVVSATRPPGVQYAKSKEVGVFYWKAPALPVWVLPTGTPAEQDQQHQDGAQQFDQAPQTVDADKILAEFSTYASSENDSERLKHRYEDTWKLLNGFAEHQNKCKDVTGIRLKELKSGLRASKRNSRVRANEDPFMLSGLLDVRRE